MDTKIPCWVASVRKWQDIDEEIRQDKIDRQRKILRDARIRYNLQPGKPDIKIRVCAGRENGRTFGC